jgi:TRAP-type C4-dicarboxylate transport system substrate-binding protein
MPRKAALRRGLAAFASAILLGAPAVAWAQKSAAMRLRVVGGLGDLNQYTRHEEHFWGEQLARLSGGRYSADIVPFDRAGIRGQELLLLVKQGTVPFATLSLSAASAKDLELNAADLTGLNPDFATLLRSVAAYRPHLDAVLRERYGLEMLALYTYPAQVTFCSKPVTGLDSLKGRRIRTASATQGDWVEALGALPVITPFAEIVANLGAGNIDCAVTGTMSGNTIGLHERTSHLQTTALTWGLSVFVANGAAWAALPADLKALLRRELPKLEKDIWAESLRETEEGVACNVGAPRCVSGRKGRMTEVRPTAADEQRRREIFANTVLPRWLQRCGPDCAEVWNRTMAPASGFEAKAR